MTTRLPFNIIDETFAHADDPTQPVTVQIEARVAESLEPHRVADAVAAALAVHPLARSRQDPWVDGAVAYEWLVDDRPQVDPLVHERASVDTDLDAVRADFHSRPLSLFESPPLRVRHVQHDDGDLIMVSVHHSAADGMGALRLLQSICRAYVGADDPTPDFDPAQARQLAIPTERPTLGARLHSGRMELQRLTRLGLPARLRTQVPTTRAGYGFTTLHVPLAPIVTAPLRRSTGATVNDVLLAAASRAAGRWNVEGGDQAGRITIQMPINARPPEWSREMVANLVTSDSVSTTTAERQSPETCLRVVAGWTDAVKKRGPGPALAAMADLPRFGVEGRRAATQWAIRAGAPLAETLVVSNLGRIPEDFVGGDGLDLVDVVFSPPAPMPYGLGIGAAAYGDHLTLVLRHRWTLWDDDANTRFGQILLDELDQLSTADPVRT